MVAFRYLRARRAHGSVSVIAGFSFAGIVLGVMALIVVMSVMNGFHHDLMEKMIGLNGHIFLQGVEKPLTDYDAVTDRVGKVPGVALALPLVEGQAFATSPFNSGPALVRGMREADLKRLPGIEGHITQGTLDGFDAGQGVAVGARLAEHLSLRVGDKITLIAPRGAQTPFGVTPRVKSYHGRGDLPDRHGDVRQHLRLHAARRSAGLFQPRRPGQRDRGLCRRSRPHRRDARPRSPPPSSGR